MTSRRRVWLEGAGRCHLLPVVRIERFRATQDGIRRDAAEFRALPDERMAARERVGQFATGAFEAGDAGRAEAINLTIT
jgi:hypothetical protein